MRLVAAAWLLAAMAVAAIVAFNFPSRITAAAGAVGGAVGGMVGVSLLLLWRGKRKP